MVLPEITMMGAGVIADWIPTNSGPIRESFTQNSTAKFEQRMTSLVYGGFSLYICYYLIS